MSIIIYHKHHIIPKHMGGSDDPSNILKCNVAMHAFLHEQLWKKYGHWQDKVAWQALSGQINMSEASKIAKIEGCRKGGLTNIGKKHSMKRRLANSRSKIGHIVTTETRSKISNSLKGRPLSKEHIQKRTESQSKTWQLIDPNGRKIIIKNLNQFCKNNNLNRGCISAIFEGRMHVHKGWTVLSRSR